MTGVLVLAVLLYMVVAGLLSVVPQVFWPEPSAWARQNTPESCAEGLRMLHSELMDQASRHIAEGGSSDGRALERWLSGWDDRHRALAPHCDDEAEQRAHSALERLRHHMQTSLRRFDREEGELARELARELQELSAQSPEKRPE